MTNDFNRQRHLLMGHRADARRARLRCRRPDWSLQLSRMFSRVACSTCTDHDVHQDHRACGGLPTLIDPRKHPCRPQSGRRRLRAIHQTIRTWPMTPAAASARWFSLLSSVCRCLRRLQAPHVYSLEVFHHPRDTRWILSLHSILSSFPRARPAKTPAVRTIEPTRGAPGRGVVHPMIFVQSTDVFAGLMFHVL